MLTPKIQRRIQTGRGGGGGAPHPREKKGLTLTFFCAPACNLQRGTQQEVVRKQRLVNARTSVLHVDSFSFRRLYYPCLA